MAHLKLNALQRQWLQVGFLLAHAYLPISPHISQVGFLLAHLLGTF